MGHVLKGVTYLRVCLAIALLVCISSALSASVIIQSSSEETELHESEPAVNVEEAVSTGIGSDSSPTALKTPSEDQQKVILPNEALPKRPQAIKLPKMLQPRKEETKEEKEIFLANAPLLPLIATNSSNLEAQDTLAATNFAFLVNSILNSNPIKDTEKNQENQKLSGATAEKLPAAPTVNEVSIPSHLKEEVGDFTSQDEDTVKTAIYNAPPALIELSGMAAQAPVATDSSLGAANSSWLNVSNPTIVRSNGPAVDSENEDDEDDDQLPEIQLTTETPVTETPVVIQTGPPDLSAFKYLIKAKACPAMPDDESPILAIILIMSSVRNVEFRNNIRKMFPTKEIEELGLRRVFILATEKTAELGTAADSSKIALAEESKEFQDIVQFNTEESFTELPKTVLLALKYAALNCKKAKYIIKTEDNILIDYYRVQEVFNEIDDDDKNKIIGHIWRAMAPIRPNTNANVNPKYITTLEEYPGDTFPIYASGLFNAVSYKTVKKLLKASKTENYYKTEDVYINGILAKAAGIEHLDISDKFTFEANTLHCCINEAENIVYKCQHMIGYGYGSAALIEAVYGRIRTQIEYCHVNKNCTELRKEDFPPKNSICV